MMEYRRLGASGLRVPVLSFGTAASRLHQTAQYGPPVDDDRLFQIVDVLDEIASETGKAIPQIALNWLTRRPTISSVLIGARNEQQLRDNLAAVGWSLTSDQLARLDAASAVTAPYPYFPYYRQEGFARLNAPAAQGQQASSVTTAAVETQAASTESIS